MHYYIFMQRNQAWVGLTAALLLAVMFVTAFISMRKDALTFDERAHIPAGYSYLTQQDFRVNPEHPPLIKDIPALPLVFLDLMFPTDSPNWQQQEAPPAWWVQFDLGTEFIYQSGNDARTIITWSRTPMIILTVLLGWFVFWWGKLLGGPMVGIISLTLFAFSPTFLAHGRLVNTDIGAVVGAMVAIYAWLRFLKSPSLVNIFIAGIAFGFAMLLKFSLILLIPLFLFTTPLYAILWARENGGKARSVTVYATKALAAAIIGTVLVIAPVYQWHVWNYPVEQQHRDTAADLERFFFPAVRDMTLWMTEQRPLQGLAQYFRGVFMASQRTAGGNTTYFLGEVSTQSWLSYFPLLYIVKMPLAFHVLTALAAIFSLWRCWQQRHQGLLAIMRSHFTTVMFFSWIGLYALVAIVGNLNIGIRHLMPIIPFLYILVAWSFVRTVHSLPKPGQIAGWSAAAVLGVWYMGSSLMAFPNYIPYYNALAGGIDHGYLIAVDSNYDWGQDFYRLLDFVEEHDIETLHLDYFGGENPKYWLGETYVRLNPREVAERLREGEMLADIGISGWIAVSVNELMGGIGEVAPDFTGDAHYYEWLEDMEPTARAGKSIFVYYIE